MVNLRQHPFKDLVESIDDPEEQSRVILLLNALTDHINSQQGRIREVANSNQILTSNPLIDIIHAHWQDVDLNPPEEVGRLPAHVEPALSPQTSELTRTPQTEAISNQQRRPSESSNSGQAIPVAQISESNGGETEGCTTPAHQSPHPIERGSSDCSVLDSESESPPPTPGKTLTFTRNRPLHAVPVILQTRIQVPVQVDATIPQRDESSSDSSVMSRSPLRIARRPKLMDLLEKQLDSLTKSPKSNTGRQSRPRKRKLPSPADAKKKVSRRILMASSSSSSSSSPYRSRDGLHSCSSSPSMEPRRIPQRRVSNSSTSSEMSQEPRRVPSSRSSRVVQHARNSSMESLLSITGNTPPSQSTSNYGIEQVTSPDSSSPMSLEPRRIETPQKKRRNKFVEEKQKQQRDAAVPSTSGSTSPRHPRPSPTQSHGQASTRQQAQSRHQPAADRTMYPCIMVGCSKTFTRRSNMLRHFRDVHNHETFRCDICDLHYSARRNLLEHQRNIHENGNNRYECRFCRTPLNSRQSRVYHERHCPMREHQ